MDALEQAEKAKKQNMIDMAVGFTAMMPLLQEGEGSPPLPTPSGGRDHGGAGPEKSASLKRAQSRNRRSITAGAGR
jgi:hypothetical protein